jgi:hypothetical protein
MLFTPLLLGRLSMVDPSRYGLLLFPCAYTCPGSGCCRSQMPLRSPLSTVNSKKKGGTHPPAHEELAPFRLQPSQAGLLSSLPVLPVFFPFILCNGNTSPRCKGGNGFCRPSYLFFPQARHLSGVCTLNTLQKRGAMVYCKSVET